MSVPVLVCACGCVVKASGCVFVPVLVCACEDVCG